MLNLPLVFIKAADPEAGIYFAIFSFFRAISRKQPKARMMNTLILLAWSEFRTLAACKAPCSVKTNGGFRRPPHPELEVAICDFKFENSSLVSN